MRMFLGVVVLAACISAGSAFAEPSLGTRVWQSPEQTAIAFGARGGRNLTVECHAAIYQPQDGSEMLYVAENCPAPAQELSSPAIPLRNALSGTPPVNRDGYHEAHRVRVDSDGTISLLE